MMRLKHINKGELLLQFLLLNKNQLDIKYELKFVVFWEKQMECEYIFPFITKLSTYIKKFFTTNLVSAQTFLLFTMNDHGSN